MEHLGWFSFLPLKKHDWTKTQNHSVYYSSSRSASARHTSRRRLATRYSPSSNCIGAWRKDTANLHSGVYIFSDSYTWHRWVLYPAVSRGDVFHLICTRAAHKCYVIRVRSWGWRQFVVQLSLWSLDFCSFAHHNPNLNVAVIYSFKLKSATLKQRHCQAKSPS